MPSYKPELPRIDGPVSEESVEVPIYGRILEDTRTGEMLAATCPACMDEYVFELRHGETIEYRCECEQVLRIVG